MGSSEDLLGLLYHPYSKKLNRKRTPIWLTLKYLLHVMTDLVKLIVFVVSPLKLPITFM